MAKFYPPEVIDELLDYVDIDDIIRWTGYKVTGSGNNGHIEECPRCGKDKDHIKSNRRKNLFHCHPCGFAGNALHWYQEVKNVGFIKAVEDIASYVGFELPGEDPEVIKKSKIINQCLWDVIDYYKQFYPSYLEVERGISKEIIKNFKCGYAPGGTSLKKVLNKKGYDDEFLINIGLIREVKGKYYDRFFGCVIIPITYKNNVIDIYGRSIKPNGGKHHYLFGKKFLGNIENINPKRPIIIVESPINFLTLQTHGITNSTFTGGAFKFGSYHKNLIKRHKVASVYIGYDTGDLSGGGQEGSIEAAKQLDSINVSSKIIQMPQGVDINEFFQTQNLSDFRKLVNEAKEAKVFEWYFQLNQIPTNIIQNFLKEKGVNE